MTLNRSADGPFAFADARELEQYDAVEWLIKAAIENNEVNNARWSDWASAQDIVDVYEPAHDGAEYNSKLGGYDEKYCTHRITIGDRGLSILSACIAGADPEKLMDAWSEELMDAESVPAPS
ncbi:hypothetical protein [Ruegeria atlantica]|uniref:hypothetical protein n=1 Tax=Ruegeria atlantica TaxID=81569 RepID=UPI002493E6D8|nr:hypothetical protein [Ruegeria atlantica]